MILHASYFKKRSKCQPTAHEHRAWLLFYSIPVLLGILNLEYIRHLALFVEALWLLLQTSISQDDLTRADKLLVQFCKQFSSLYGTYKALWYTLNMELCPLSPLFSGKKHMSANVHQLLHFTDSVKHLGPLWAHNTFPFENVNGTFRNLFHGSRTPDVQVHHWQKLNTYNCMHETSICTIIISTHC